MRCKFLAFLQYAGRSPTKAAKARSEAALGRVPWTWQMKMTTFSWSRPTKAFPLCPHQPTPQPRQSQLNAKCRDGVRRRWGEPGSATHPGFQIFLWLRRSTGDLISGYCKDLTCVDVRWCSIVFLGGASLVSDVAEAMWNQTWWFFSFPVALCQILPRDGPPPKKAPIQPVACIMSARWFATLFKH